MYLSWNLDWLATASKFRSICVQKNLSQPNENKVTNFGVGPDILKHPKRLAIFGLAQWA
jgi:hypothetical protein